MSKNCYIYLLMSLLSFTCSHAFAFDPTGHVTNNCGAGYITMLNFGGPTADNNQVGYYFKIDYSLRAPKKGVACTVFNGWLSFNILTLQNSEMVAAEMLLLNAYYLNLPIAVNSNKPAYSGTITQIAIANDPSELRINNYQTK
jgi:hypothetical protein